MLIHAYKHRYNYFYILSQQMLKWEFPGGLAGTSVVITVAQVWSLGRELLHAMDMAKETSQNKTKTRDAKHEFILSPTIELYKGHARKPLIICAFFSNNKKPDSHFI